MVGGLFQIRSGALPRRFYSVIGLPRASRCVDNVCERERDYIVHMTGVYMYVYIYPCVCVREREKEMNDGHGGGGGHDDDGGI